jgi:hypothetical protein
MSFSDFKWITFRFKLARDIEGVSSINIGALDKFLNLLFKPHQSLSGVTTFTRTQF